MKVSISFPNEEKLTAFLEKQSAENFTYAKIGNTASTPPENFDFDHNFMKIGTGKIAFEAAKKALQNWQQFPSNWTKNYTPKTPPFEGQTVAVLFKLFGLWWWNSARIVYTFDEEKRFGFAYGTLQGHIEKGEEVFYIEMNEKEEVFYHIKAFSKPAYYLIWMAYPIARFFQRKFVKESMLRMKKITENHE